MGLYVACEWGFLEFYFNTIAAVRQRIAIGYSRVLRKLANQGGKQRHFAGPPVSLREHSSAVGTDVFRNCPFPNPGRFQAGEVDLDRERVALLHSRVETLQTKKLRLRTAMTGLLA